MTTIESLREEIEQNAELLSDLDFEIGEAVEAFLQAGRSLRIVRKKAERISKRIDAALELIETLESDIIEKDERIESLSDAVRELEEANADLDGCNTKLAEELKRVAV